MITSQGEQWILFPENHHVFLGFVSGNIEIQGQQNSLFPKRPVIKESLRWLETVSSTFQDLQFDGSL